MLIIYYVWSIVVDLFLFFRTVAYGVLEIPFLRADILGWLFIAGYSVFGVWWNPLTGQSKWTVLSGMISAASFLAMALTFTLLFNKNNLFRKGWSKALTIKGARSLQQGASEKVELVVGSGESQTRCLAFTDSALILLLEHDKTRGAEFPFNETSVELGTLCRYFLIRPCLRLNTKSLGDVPAYVFKADPAVLYRVFDLINSNHPAAPRAVSKRKKVLVPMVLAAGMLLTFTFGSWRVTTITHPEPTYPVGIINSNQVALYELSTTQSRLIANLKLGDEVLVIKEADNWYYVLTATEQAGYVAKGFVNPKSEK